MTKKRKKPWYETWEVTCVTITTDASWDPRTKVAGYAFVIKCSNFTSRGSGQLKTNPENINQAELMAIGNALNYLITNHQVKSKHLVINTDSTSAIGKIKEPNCEISRQVRKYYSQAIAMLKCHKHSLRHVKSHNGNPDARSHVNSWCDKWAKYHMKQKLSTLNLKTTEQC